MTPPVSVRVMIRHSPGSMPSAYAAVATSVSMAAVSATLMETDPGINDPVTIYPAHFAWEA